MTGAIIWAIVVLVLGIPFVLVWWKLADRWADDEHKRFKGRDAGPAPTVVKRTDVGVYEAVRDLAQGTFSGGVKAYGLAEQGVGPAFLVLEAPDPAVTLPQDVQDQVGALADQIVSGEIVVTDYLAQPAASPAS